MWSFSSSIRNTAALLGALIMFLTLGGAPARAEFRAGAASIDITPQTLPVLVNGGFMSRSVDKIKTPLHARALALVDGKERFVIVVVDSCMMGRPLLDEVKALAAKRSGLRPDRILISATHAHSAPSALPALGTEADPNYVPFLRGRLVEAIAAALAALEPARIGFAKVNAADFTASRQWILRSDRVGEDPFGNRTVHANMHAGRNPDDATGQAGPEDPDLSLVAVQSRAGRPLAVLANFSMHYFSDQDISADYYGLFCEGLRRRLAPGEAAGQAPFVGMMSHGCSGDIWRRNYNKPEREWNANLKIEDYADGMLNLAEAALRGVQYRDDADLAMAERHLTLNYRVPNAQMMEWAQRIVTAMGGRAPRTQTEVYAREQLVLNDLKKTEVVVQALRVGEIAIAASPCETYALTGLKIKAASPLPQTFVIELANGAEGYIPPPEQHLLGGYNTWPARSAGLEPAAEPRIAETAIELLEEVSGKPRRAWKRSDGPAAKATLETKPMAYWRLNEVAGPHAIDASDAGRDAVYEPGITYYLEGPRAEAFCGADEANRAPHFAGGRVRARLAGLGERYSVSLWLWNGMPAEGRDVAGWLFSRGRDSGLGTAGDHLGIGGKSGNAGKLVFFHGDDPAGVVAGKTVVPRWQWQHAVLVRDGEVVRVYLNGKLEIETKAAASLPADLECFFGGRSDGEASWEGRLDEIAVWDRALTADEMARLSPAAAK